MSDCFYVSVNLSLSVYLGQLRSLSVILCHLVSISIFHAICLSHSVSVSLSHSVYLQHVSVRLFLSLCTCQSVPSAHCPVPPSVPIFQFLLLGLLLLLLLLCLNYYGLFSVFLMLSMEKNLNMATTDFGNNAKKMISAKSKVHCI